MNISIKNCGKEYEIVPEGKLDYTNMEEFDAAVSSVLPEADKIVINMEKTDYISSAGIRVIIDAFDELETKGGVSLVNCNSLIREIIEMTGLRELLA